MGEGRSVIRLFVYDVLSILSFLAVLGEGGTIKNSFGGAKGKSDVSVCFLKIPNKSSKIGNSLKPLLNSTWCCCESWVDGKVALMLRNSYGLSVRMLKGELLLLPKAFGVNK